MKDGNFEIELIKQNNLVLELVKSDLKNKDFINQVERQIDLNKGTIKYLKVL